MYKLPNYPRQNKPPITGEVNTIPSGFSPATNTGAAASAAQIDMQSNGLSNDDVLSQAKIVPFGSRLAKSACVEAYTQSEQMHRSLDRYQEVLSKTKR